MQGQHWQISLQPCWCINTVISDAVWMREPLSEAESFWYQRGKWFSADHYTHWPVISSTSCEAASELSPWFIIYFSLVPGSASRAAWSSTEELFWVQLDTWRKQCEIMALPGSPLMLEHSTSASAVEEVRDVTGHPTSKDGWLCHLCFFCQGFYWGH